LNLRSWQFAIYGAKSKNEGCSSLAITLADGTVACTGALDDPAVYYCGPIKFVPDNGYSCITFPITGTSWGNRGMNDQGLSLCISSLILPGLRRLDHTINQDLACRAILQTCGTVDEVRELCRAHPFTLSLIAVDTRGKIFYAQNTMAGLYEMPAEEFCALTNHVANDQLRQWLTERGVTEFPESSTTRPRRDNLLTFAHEQNGRCTAGQVREFIARRNDADPASICHSGTVCLTFSNPQVAARTMWIQEPQNADHPADFIPYQI
jgi:hypothetical protein